MYLVRSCGSAPHQGATHLPRNSVRAAKEEAHEQGSRLEIRIHGLYINNQKWMAFIIKVK